MPPRLKNASLKVTAFRHSQFPVDNPGEIAFAGKSNVGKSSLLNRIMGTKKLVKVSSRPGFTQSINFYSIVMRNDKFDREAFFVDLPGYGYAKAPRSIIKKWERLIEQYFSSDRSIKGVVTIFDVRRDLNELDLGLLSFLKFQSITTIPVLNKCDKLGSSILHSRVQAIRDQLEGLGVGFEATERLISVSARTGRNVPELRSLLLTLLFD